MTDVPQTVPLIELLMSIYGHFVTSLTAYYSCADIKLTCCSKK